MVVWFMGFVGGREVGGGMVVWFMGFVEGRKKAGESTLEWWGQGMGVGVRIWGS